MKITCFCKLLLLSIVGLGCAQKISAMTRDDLEEVARIRAWHENLASRGLIKFESRQSVECVQRSISTTPGAGSINRARVRDEEADERLMSPARFSQYDTFLLPAHRASAQRMPGGVLGGLLVCCAGVAGCYCECVDSCMSGAWCENIKELAQSGWLMCCCLKQCWRDGADGRLHCDDQC